MRLPWFKAPKKLMDKGFRIYCLILNEIGGRKPECVNEMRHL